MKVAVVTDLHIGFLPKKLKVFGDFIENLDAEILIICGDIASSKQSEIEQCFQEIRKRRGKNELEVLVIFGNHDCLDSNTELLTKRGWVTYTDIKKDDQVLSIDENDKSVWTYINDFILRKSNSISYFKNQNIDIAVTPNHRIPFYKRKCKIFGDLQYDVLENLKGRIALPVAKKNNNPDYLISEDELRLLAWVLSDGHVSKTGSYYIYQSKLEGISQIKTMLTNLNYNYNLRFRNRNIQHICGKKLKSPPLPQGEFYIKSDSCLFLKKHIGPGKKIKDAELFNKLSPKQLELFIRVLMEADGSWVKNKKSGALNGSKKFLDWVQTLTVQCGIRSGLIEYRPGHYRLNIVFNRETTQIEDVYKSVLVDSDYNDYVWCLNVPYSNFMVRRNGKSYFTGNCWDDSYEFNTIVQIKNHHKELCKKYQIHYLQENKYENDTIVVWGFDGWYRFANVASQDSAFMPLDSGEGELTPFQYLQRCEQKGLYYILDDLPNYEKSDKIKIVVTHFNPILNGDSFASFSGNLRVPDLIKDDVDYLFYGHTHQVRTDTIGKCKFINVGADYKHSPNHRFSRFWKVYEFKNKG